VTEHFGVRVQAGSKNGLRLKRENYARINKRRSKWIPREMAPELWDATAHIYEDDEHRFYTDEWCEKHRSLALQNFTSSVTTSRDTTQESPEGSTPTFSNTA